MSETGKEHSQIVSGVDFSNAPILIVDDEEESILLLEFFLHKAGFNNVHSITDPRLASDLYRDIKPYLVLLDIRMPYMDGFEVLQQLKEVEGDNYVPVLVLTASNEPEVRHKALQYGARDFLNKPFDRIETINRIRNLIEVRLLYNQKHEQNQLLEELVKERTRELEETRLEVIYRLGRAADYRDSDTGKHVVRISEYSGILARAMGLSNSWCELIRNASPMHDIGKIGVPDSILCKPGKLDDSEFDMMKRHTIIGASILSQHNSQLMRVSEEIALMYHEKWDGSGYPHGLSGDGIPIHCRIVSVVDVFDALTTQRPYKKAWSVADAISEIHSLRGKSFDPDIVDSFIGIISEVEAIRGRHIDKYHDDECSQTVSHSG